MAKLPKVSIVCVTYNQEKYIRQTLQGFVIQKTDFDFEIIVADDASTDKTPEIIKEFAADYPGLFRLILRKKNLGVVGNFVDSMQAATGTYIAICEGDDYWTDPGKLQIQADFLDKNPACVGCFHRVKLVYEGNEKAESVFPDVEDKTWYTTDELFRTNYIPTNSVMYRKQKYTDIPSDIMPFDWYLHLYHARFGKIAFIDKVMSVYRKHDNGVWWEYDVDRDKIWKKYGLLYLTMFNEVSKLYKGHPGRNKIIDESINQTLDTFIGVDEKHGTSLLGEALAKFPERREPFMIYQHRKFEEKQHEQQVLEERLLQVGDEKTALAIERDIALKELDRITNTRTWKLRTKTGRVIKRKKRQS